MKIPLDIVVDICQSKVTKDSKSAWRWLPQFGKTGAAWNWKEFLAMHDFLIALVFVAMVASPAILASAHKATDNE